MTPAVAVPKGSHTHVGARMLPYLTAVSQNFTIRRNFTSHRGDANLRLEKPCAAGQTTTCPQAPKSLAPQTSISLSDYSNAVGKLSNDFLDSCQPMLVPI